MILLFQLMLVKISKRQWILQVINFFWLLCIYFVFNILNTTYNSLWIASEKKMIEVPILQVAAESGYNMVHFTPIQELGISNSAYSIRDQLRLSPVYSPGQQKYNLDDVEGLVEHMNKTWGVSLTHEPFWSVMLFLKKSPWKCRVNVISSYHHEGVGMQALYQTKECVMCLKVYSRPRKRMSFLADSTTMRTTASPNPKVRLSTCREVG